MAYYLVINIDRREPGLVATQQQTWRSGTTQSKVLGPRWANALRPETVSLPPFATRLVGIALALAVSTVHVTDQGGITDFTAPDWLGWAYRLIEVGGVLVALTLLVPQLGVAGWAAGVLLGIGPMAGYLASRTVGVPSDPGDVGNWSDWVAASLVIEAAIILPTPTRPISRRD